MKITTILIQFFSLIALSAPVCVSKTSPFSARSIEQNIVTGKYQIDFPYYKGNVSSGIIVGDTTVRVVYNKGAEKHLCKFLGFSGGNVLSIRSENNKAFVEIDEDGRYYSSSESDTYITMLECDK